MHKARIAKYAGTADLPLHYRIGAVAGFQDTKWFYVQNRFMLCRIVLLQLFAVIVFLTIFFSHIM